MGTFEFTSKRVLAIGYNHHASIKMRTGGSSGKISRTQARSLAEGDGYVWDLVAHNGRNDVKLPVKYRYRSPIIFEFHTTGGLSRKADAYALIWLQHLIDNEDTPFNLPIWRTKNGPRLTQNYITEENVHLKEGLGGLEDLEEVGRLQFRGRFKAGLDETHRHFIDGNNARETYETWEACLSEGVRQKMVEKEIPEKTQQLHDESLTEGRDMLKEADEDEKKKWLTKDGADWSGAFGHDPKAYMNTKSGQKKREPGAEEPVHDPIDPSSDEDSGSDNDSDGDEPDLGITDHENMDEAARQRGGASQSKNVNGNTSGANRLVDDSGDVDGDAKKTAKRTDERKHRGLMQWKPARNLKFAKDEGIIGLKKLKKKITGGMDGRQPGVETEV